MSDSLTQTVTTGHGMLHALLLDTTYVAFPRQARDHQNRADAFLISACRHVSAVSTCLVDQLAGSGDREGARRMARDCHDLQVTMMRAKGRLYGSSLSRAPWPEIWSEVVDGFEALATHEARVVHDLSQRLSPEALDALAHRLCRLEERAPTRPHPRIPHSRFRGRVAHSVWRFTDRLWDEVEGRCAPPCTPFTQG